MGNAHTNSLVEVGTVHRDLCLCPYCFEVNQWVLLQYDSFLAKKNDVGEQDRSARFLRPSRRAKKVVVCPFHSILHSLFEGLSVVRVVIG